MVNGAMSSITRSPARADPGVTAYRLALLALVCVLLGLGAAYGISALAKARGAAAPEPALLVTHHKTVGAQRYSVPAALLRGPGQRQDGFAERMDLAMALPLGPDGRMSEIAIAIVPRARVRTSAHLLDTVYVHQFGPEHIQGPSGLVGKPLRQEAGYGGETVWYDPLSPNPFVAKCMEPLGMDGRTCLRTLLLSDRNAAILSFEPAALAHWRRMDALLEERLATLRR